MKSTSTNSNSKLETNDKDMMIKILKEVKEIKIIIEDLPKWMSVSDVAKDKGLTPQAVRKQLLSGNYEPDIDFKYIGNKMYISISTIKRIFRIRRTKK